MIVFKEFSVIRVFRRCAGFVVQSFSENSLNCNMFKLNAEQNN
jgi:hypothetical protein